MPHTINNQRGEGWKDCARCGAKYPLSELHRQDGLLVCYAHCTYELGAQYYRSLQQLPEGESVVTEPEDDEVTL